MLTLGVHEVVNQHIVTTVGLQRSVLEGLFWAVAHVLLSQRLDMAVDVVGVLRWKLDSHDHHRPGNASYQLLLKRDLVQLELVDLCRGSTQQRRSCEQGEGLHDCRE